MPTTKVRPMDDVLMQWSTLIEGLPWQMAGTIGLSALLGAVIGFEREWTGHTAGLRTTMLVAVGSCLFTVISIHGFPLDGETRDTARVAAQIVSGIGFLGAGALFQSHDQIKGLTTAATIWLVAAIGMAVGTGLYAVAIFTTVLTVLVLIALKPVGDLISERDRRRRGKPPERSLRVAIQQPGPRKPRIDKPDEGDE